MKDELSFQLKSWSDSFIGKRGVKFLQMYFYLMRDWAMEISKDLLFIDFDENKKIVYNYYIHKAVLVKKVLYEYIKQNMGKELNNKCIGASQTEQLIRNGVVIDDCHQYKLKIHKMKDIRQCLSIVYFHVTQKCNLNCRYCYNKHNLNVKNELSTSQVKYVLETLNRNGIKTINFTGGEALIREDIFEIIEYSKQLGFKNVLLTNGTLLKDKMGVLRSVDECIISIDNWDEDSNDDERRGSKNYSLLSMLDEIDASVKEKVKIRSVIVKGKEKELHENKKYFEKK